MNATNSYTPRKTKISKYLVPIIISSFLLVVLVYGIYFWNFYGKLSNEQNIWGVFGDYVGGTLNPIFAFVSFVALLYTIIIQSRELELTRKELGQSREIAEEHKNHIKKQAHKDDLYKMIVNVDKEINELLEKPANISHTKATLKGDTNRPMKDFFGRFSDEVAKEDIPIFQKGKGSNNPNIVKYTRAIAELYNYLDLFEREAEDAVLTDYYKRRHLMGVNTLKIFNYIGEKINGYFKSCKDLDYILEHDSL